MNCQTTQNLLNGYADGELDLLNHVQIEQHLKDCPSCARICENLSTLKSALSAASSAKRDSASSTTGIVRASGAARGGGTSRLKSCASAGAGAGAGTGAGLSCGREDVNCAIARGIAAGSLCVPRGIAASSLCVPRGIARGSSCAPRGAPVSRSIKASAALKTSAQRPQRTQPSDTRS